MGTELPEQPKTQPLPHYRWPWFVWGAVVLGFLLAFLWMSLEIERTRRIRDANALPPSTNAAPSVTR